MPITLRSCFLVLAGVNAAAGSADAQQVAAAAAGDTIVVTGTRAADATAAQATAPISIVSNEALSRSSQSSLGAALQAIVPSIDFPQSTVASAAGAHLNATLRGLAPDQTLVLFDGDRAHKSAFVNTKPGSSRGTEAVDLTIVPMSMIDHIEVLEDAAGAQYGSDAIAGVINIVMRNNDSGGSAELRSGVWEDGDGFTTYLRAWKGLKLFGDGRLILALDVGHADNTNQNISPEKYAYYFPGDPREATVDKESTFYRGQPEIRIDVRAAARLDLPLTDTLSYSAFANYAYKNSLINATELLPNSNSDVRAIYPNGSQPRHSVDLHDITFDNGLHWKPGFFDRIDLDATYGRSHESYGTRDTVNASLGLASPTSFHTGALTSDQVEVTLDLIKAVQPSFFAGPLTLSSGAAWRHEHFAIAAGEPSSYANGGALILDGPNAGQPAPFGSYTWQAFTPGDAGAIGRDVYSLYAAAEGKLLDPLRISLSGRAEHYSDFGTVVTGQASARLALTRDWAIRASVSNGVRAPSLGQERFSWIQSTFLTGVTNLYQLKTYPVTSPVAIALGATALKPERSLNLSAGTVLTLGRQGAITIDAYSIKIRHRIALSDNFTGEAVTALVTAAGDTQVVGANFFTNALDTRTTGITIAGNYRFDLGRLGRLSTNLGIDLNKTEATKVRTINGKIPVGPETIGYLERGTPRTKVIGGGEWSKGAFRFDATGTYYGAVEQKYANPISDQRFSPLFVINASVGCELRNGVDVSIGADNLFGVKPDPINTWPGTGGFPESVLDPIPYDGRFVWLQLRVKI